MKNTVSKIIASLVGTGARKGTVYLSPTYVVKVSRQRPADNRDRRETYIVTCGIPNYLERIFIKQCKKAGELFPIKKTQLKFYTNKKKAKK